MNKKWRRVWIITSLILVSTGLFWSSYAGGKRAAAAKNGAIRLSAQTLPLRTLQGFAILINPECQGDIVCVTIEHGDAGKQFCLCIQIKTAAGETVEQPFVIPELKNVDTVKGLMRFDNKNDPVKVY